MFDPSSVTPAALPSVPLDSRRDLPACQGIYFVLSSGGNVLYIGMAKNILSRWRGHPRLTELKQQPGVTISWLHFDGDKGLLYEIERACIEYFNPVLNWSPVECGLHVRTVGFPPDLYARIVEIATREDRDTTAQIIRMLRESLERQGAREQA